MIDIMFKAADTTDLIIATYGLQELGLGAISTDHYTDHF